MDADMNVGVNVSIEEKCELNGSRDDLPTADCNGLKNRNGNVEGNEEDDSDASYVFVAGKDDPAETVDLNGKCESVDNFGKDTENEVNPGIMNIISSIPPVEKDADSPSNNEVALGRENGAVEAGNATVPEQIREELVEQGSPLDAQGTPQTEANAEVAVKHDTEPSQAVIVSSKTGKEDSMDSDVPENSVILSSIGVAEIEQNGTDEAFAGESHKLDVQEQVEEEYVNLGSSLAEQRSREVEVNDEAADELELSKNIAEDSIAVNYMEQSAEDSIAEKNVEKSAEDSIADKNGEKSAEDNIAEKNVEKSAEDNIAEKNVEKSEDSIPEKSVEKSAEDSIAEKSVEKSAEDSISVKSTENGTETQKSVENSAENIITEKAVENGTNDSTTEKSAVESITDVAESEQNLAVHVEGESEVNQSSDDDHEIEGETKLNLVTDSKENKENDNDMDLGQSKESVASTEDSSRMELEENSDTHSIPCNEYANANGLPPDNAQENALEINDVQNTSVQNSLPPDAGKPEMVRIEDPSSDTETAKNCSGLNDNEALGIPTNGIALPTVQLEAEAADVKKFSSLEAEADESSVNVGENTSEEIQVSEVLDQAVDDMGTETVAETDDAEELTKPDVSPLVTDATPSCLVSEIMADSTTESLKRLSTSSSDELGISAQQNGLVDEVLSGEVKVSQNGHISKEEDSTDCVIANERNVDCTEDNLQGGDKDPSMSIDGPEKMHQEIEVVVVSREDSMTSPPEACIDGPDCQDEVVEVVKRPFYYLIRIPRYDDHENLKEQIKHAQSQVDAKTKSRDLIRVEMQEKKAICNEYGDLLKSAKSEEVAARELLKAKRKEIESVVNVINKVKSASSIEDIDGKIRSMEHMIQHETLPLKEEKNYLREMKQLKQLRGEISSSLGKQEDVQEAINQKEHVEERLKLLRKEADLLRENVLKAEASTKNARKRYHDENAKLYELINQFRAADNIRQEAYAHLQSLRKRSYDKNKHFWKYKDDLKAAYNLESKGHREELQQFCINQVETFMELWNNNDEFREEYTRCNMRSTVRRLQTLDGRSLGPDEEPVLLPTLIHERVAKDNTESSISNTEGDKTVAPVELEKTDNNAAAKVVEPNNQTVKSKKQKPAKSAPVENGSTSRDEIEKAVVSGRDEIENLGQVEPKKSKEEEELARKAEELRKAEEAAILKEQKRLEEKAKAKEAMERKKRNADKAQARAALRAQKEAEQKEKEREKKARKKDKKKALADDGSSVNEGEPSPVSETPTETNVSEIPDKPTTAKRTQKPSQFVTQRKSKSMPPPLRNRSKRRMQTWMWILLTALMVLALFLIGNGSFPLQWFGF